MKRIVGVILLCMLCMSVTGCAKTYHGTDELIEKARKEIPIVEADNTEIQYAGMCGEDNKAIAWFISGNEYQAHYYLPMEIEIKGNGANYTFVRTYKPMDDRARDVAILNWNSGYAFLINNPQIAKVQIVLENGEIIEESVKDGIIPYTFFVDTIPTEYAFLDSEGNEIQ